MKLQTLTCLSAFAVLLFAVGFIPFMSQYAFAAVTSVTINEPIAGTSFGADFLLDYTVSSNGTNTASAGTITFTQTGGSPDAGTHVYTMGVPADTSDGAHSISRTTLEADAGFDALVDGAEYTIDISITDGIAFTDQELVVTADFTAPSFTALKTASNQITLTWDENVNSVLDTATAGNPFTLGGTALTVASTSALDGTSNTQTLTLSGKIVDGSSITVSYDKDAVNGDITDTATTDPNEAPDINNVDLSGIPAASGGCDSDCEVPTLGVDSRGNRLVSNGFTYNEHSVDVERFFTPYPLIKVNVGEENRADFKIYENTGPENIKHFSLAFGLDKDQVISQSKAMIELDIDSDGKEIVTVTDPENVLENVRVETSLVSCDGDKRVNCLGVTIYHTFRAPLEFDIIATDVWDTKRFSWQNYYNHGIEVAGESLNPLPTAMIPSPAKNEGLVLVTQTEKYNDIWTTNDGRIFEMNSFGSFKQINQKFERFQDTGNAFTRVHSGFASILDYEKNRATAVFDASLLISELPDSFGYHIVITERIDKEMKQEMLLQEEIAKEILDEMDKLSRNY